ncbi:MAG: sensor domain-containing protein, partial [Actinomycetota bacterium]
MPTNVPRLDDSAVDHVLLPIGEVNDVMGTTDLEITSDIKTMPDSSDKVSDADCLGAMFGAEKPVYKGSGWTAVRDVVAREPEDDNAHWIEQTAVIYPEAANANMFLQRSRSTWQRCAASSLAVNTEDTSSLWEFGDVSSGDGLISQTATQEDADGW